jgi:hypothetical protein
MGLAIGFTGFTGFTDTCVAPVPTCLAACSLASPIHHALAPASWADSPAHPAFASATTLLPLYFCLLAPASLLLPLTYPHACNPASPPLATLAWCYHSLLLHFADRRTATLAFVPDLSNGRGATSSPPPCLLPQPCYHATTTYTSARTQPAEPTFRWCLASALAWSLMGRFTSSRAGSRGANASRRVP